MKRLLNIMAKALTVALVVTADSCENDPGNPITSVTVEPATLSLFVGKTASLTATVLPENAEDKAVTWSSSDESIAKVDAAGEVSAIAAGVATVTATVAGGKTAGCTVTVENEPENPITSVTVEPANLSLSIGETTSLRATVLPEDAEDKTVIWSSSDESIAKVDAKGEVRAVANGLATLTATAAGGKTASCTVTVGPAVYVAGDANIGGINVARVWKNGEVLYELSDPEDRTKYSSASSMYVSGKDVYVAGHISPASDSGNGLYLVGPPVATVWKNGVEQALSGSIDGSVSRASSIQVSGSDVYVAGYEAIDGSRTPPVLTVWKNGTPQVLSDSLGNIEYCLVFVSGNDVYASGKAGTGYMSKIWKNGVVQYAKDATVSSIFVSSGDIYEAGFENGESSTATVWKNNEILYKFYDSKKQYRTTANSIYISGGDVYVAGYEVQNKYVAVLWKNGTPQNLGGGASPSAANSVFVLGSDVYVAGYEGDIAAVWKNGNVQRLADIKSACSIFVK
jgi:hypothetical protein